MRGHRLAHPGRAPHREGDVPRQAAHLLSMAAAPVFAVMAMASAAPGDHAMMMCGGMMEQSALAGMPVMYGLMAVLHLGPWLALIGPR